MSKIDEARDILEQLGLPSAQRNDISRLTLLALTGLPEDGPWSQASKPSRTIHRILGFMRDVYGTEYAENIRENVRRQVIHQLEQARVVDRNPDAPDLPTNSPRTHYGRPYPHSARHPLATVITDKEGDQALSTTPPRMLDRASINYHIAGHTLVKFSDCAAGGFLLP